MRQRERERERERDDVQTNFKSIEMDSTFTRSSDHSTVKRFRKRSVFDGDVRIFFLDFTLTSLLNARTTGLGLRLCSE